MNVTDALFARHGCRSFKPEPVDQNTIKTILEVATRAASGGNSQPWEIFVAGGDALERVKQEFLSNSQNGPQTAPDMSKVPIAHQARMQELLSDMGNVAGESVKEIGELMGKFFNAPAVIYLCMDKNLAGLSFFDLGALSQSIMLKALEHGLSTMPAGCFVQYPEILHKELSIPDELSIIAGIAIGYEDNLHPINKFRSRRRPIEEVVTFKGFE
nr:nitroreductase [Sedimentibacter sp.]